MASPSVSQFRTAIAVNRLGLGARPGELDQARDAEAWLRRQLEGPPPVLEGEGLGPAARTFTKALERRREERERRRAEGAEGAEGARPAIKLPALYRPVYADEVRARFAHAVSTDRPFLERLTQFWSNHFAVSVDKLAVLGLAGAFEREAVRPHVTGSFTDLLIAVEKHPAMLLYLDNQASMGPNSRAAKLTGRRANARKADINENLAREILELHTLGVNGGYTQRDVTAFAMALSGWSVGGEVGRARDRGPGGTPGEFFFREAFHEPGAKRLLGRSHADDGVRQGEAILRDLAMRPQTARHVCAKLARHLVADDPPPALVRRMAKAWLDSGAHLPAVYDALIASPETWSTPLSKFKTPADYIHSVYRGLAIPAPARRRASYPFDALGQRTLGPGSPAGWPDTSADWDGPSALLKRIAWADAVAQRLDGRNARELAPQLLGTTLATDTMRAIAAAESGAQALTLLIVSPEFMRR